VSKAGLLVGAAEVDITPPVGTALAGSLWPRKSEGTDDPLTAKAIVLESGGTRLAYVLLDLIALHRRQGDAAVALAAQRTGIPAERIVWAASHTHTGPYPGKTIFGAEAGGVDRRWLAGIPGKFAEAVELAQQALRPARMCRERGYCHQLIHNRRLKFKDGRELNTFLLHKGEEEVQCLGSAAPVDPEVGILSFDDEGGVPIAILWHYTLHTNSNFGRRFSADYPGVVAARLRERFGAQTVPIFMPGAFADINPTGWCRQVGDELAKVIIERMNRRRPSPGRVALGALKKEVVVPYRDFRADGTRRIRASQWPPEAQKVFRRELARMRQAGETSARTVVQAWRIGDVGFASLPGELFVEWGLKIKAQSPFPWTFPVELGGDYLGYLVTEQAWKAGGYECLTCRSARPSVEGVARLVESAQALLRQLWQRGSRRKARGGR
jgi:neutral ceramidase